MFELFLFVVFLIDKVGYERFDFFGFVLCVKYYVGDFIVVWFVVVL